MEKIAALNRFWEEQIHQYSVVANSCEGGSFEDFDPIKSLGYLRLRDILSSRMGLGGASVLEPGCGSGLVLCYFSKLGANCTGLIYRIKH